MKSAVIRGNRIRKSNSCTLISTHRNYGNFSLLIVLNSSHYAGRGRKITKMPYDSSGFYQYSGPVCANRGRVVHAPSRAGMIMIKV
jgi:hypothetical protein